MYFSSGVIRQFGSADRGGIAIWLAVATMVVGALFGSAIDFGRWISARNHTQRAIEAAKVAGARALSLSPGDHASAVRTARKAYEAAVWDRLTTDSDSVDFAVTRDGRAMATSGNVEIAMPFVSLVGPARIPLLRASSHAGGIIPTVAGPPPKDTSRSDLEVAVMVDISGSMAGWRLAATQTGLEALVDGTIWPQPARFKARMSLVPVSGDIRPPAGLANALEPSRPGFKAVDRSGWWSSEAWFAASACVGGDGSDATGPTFDKPPSAKLPLRRAYQPAPAAGDTSAPCAAPSAAGVVPLTSSRTELSKAIGALSAEGETALDAGISWAGFMLSPAWGPSFGDGMAPGPFLLPSLRKVAVIVTDGGFAVAAQPVQAPAASDAETDVVGAGIRQYRNAMHNCAELKKRGVEIHVIGIALDSDLPGSLLVKACASDRSKAHFVNDADALRQALAGVSADIAARTQIFARK